MENVTEKQPETGEKKKKTDGKNKRVEQGSDYQPALRTEGEKLNASNCFLLNWKEELQMKSALEDDKPFFWLS